MLLISLAHSQLKMFKMFFLLFLKKYLSFLFFFLVLVVRCFLSTIFNDLCSPLEFKICFTQWKFFEIFSKISHDHRPPALHVLICLNVSQTCIRRIYISNSTQLGRKSLHLTLSRIHARLDGWIFWWVIQFSSFFSCWKIYWIISSLLSRIFFLFFTAHKDTLFLCHSSGNFPILQFFLTTHRKELRSLSPQILLVCHNEIFPSFFPSVRAN